MSTRRRRGGERRRSDAAGDGGGTTRSRGSRRPDAGKRSAGAGPKREHGPKRSAGAGPKREHGPATPAGTDTPPADLHAALARAVQRRRDAGLPEPGVTDLWRLVHERWDGLDDLIVDVFGDVAVLRLRDARWHAPKTLRTLASALASHGFLQQHVLVDERRKHTPREHAALEARLRGELEALGLAPREESRVVVENGLRYEVRLDEGFSQGLFLDMREVRRDLARRWEGRRIANLFAYTCGFGVALAARNEVVNVDVSRRYLAWGRHNYALNGLEVRDACFVEKDAFAFLETALKRDIRWDAIILDPPVQSRGKKGVSRPFALRRDLGALIEQALDALAPGGELFVSTNLDALAPAAFRRLVIGIARDRASWLERQWPPPPDFPVPPQHYHLKTALLREERGNV